MQSGTRLLVFGEDANTMLLMKSGLRLSTLSYALFESLSAIDHGGAPLVTFDNIYTGIQEKTLFTDLEKLLGD